jgi:hypothetical protein
MMSRRERRVRLVVHGLAGGMLLLLALFADPLLGRPRVWGGGNTAALVLGVAIVLLGLRRRPDRLAGLTANACVSLLAVFGALALAEVCFRVLDVELARPERAWRQIAPYYRQPTVPLGEVFFRRQGPEVWTGQVINTQMRRYRVSPNPYASEPVITVRYDSLGFRAVGDPHDWEIVVAGDSFTELGYLPDEQLFTTLLGQRLNARVRNLGVSQTGPLTQLSYLQHFGVAPATKHAVIVFFEGNDLWDVREEYERLEHWRRTGEREQRTVAGPSSLIRLLDATIQAYRTPPIGPDASIHAHFAGRDGKLPITLVYEPASAAEVKADTTLMRALEQFFTGYGEWGREHGIRTWLAFMPTKLRAAHGHLRFAAEGDEPFARWTPTDLPDLIARFAASHGIEFVDLTPAIAAAMDSTGEFLYNSIYDTHLNEAGSSVVADALAERIGEAVSPGAGSARGAKPPPAPRPAPQSVAGP